MKTAKKGITPAPAPKKNGPAKPPPNFGKPPGPGVAPAKKAAAKKVAAKKVAAKKVAAKKSLAMSAKPPGNFNI